MLRFGIIIILGIFLNHTAMAHGDVHTRIDIVSAEIADDSGNPVLYVKRASLYLEDGDFKSTGDDLKKSQKLGGKEFGPAILGYAKMYHKLGNHEVALKYINSFLEIDQIHVRGLLTKGNILASMNDIEGASEYFRMVIENTSTPLPDNYFRLIHALESLGRNSEAVFYCEAAMRELGQLMVFEQKIIELQLKANNYNAAIEQLDNILIRQERKEKWHYQKAMIYKDMGDYDAAAEQFTLAMKSIRSLPERIQFTPAMKTLMTKIKDQRNEANQVSDDPIITGKVYTK